MDTEMAERAIESEEALVWRQEDTVSELDGLDTLLTWQQWGLGNNSCWK